ncbi:hypothetical protein BT63DRAFT_478070 [Microthyrium microscopicum]|uniref:Hook C-terminal domain-containing protein n=1 Tax=Microthyrium microscopicum TaxID=703497 RepID=A0A6A6UCF6_9PEZI|nr:hypothetical protein BT63DRAFT_478070 [Microthyrium microscopicum]
MNARNSHRSPRDEPGLDATFTTTERMVDREDPPGSPRAVPEIRKKNKHLNEIYNLKQEVTDLQDDNEKLHQSIGKMALDLDKAEKQLEMKKRDHEMKDSQLLALQQRVDELTQASNFRNKMEVQSVSPVDQAEHQRLQNELSRLTLAVIDKDGELRDKDKKLAEAQSTAATAASQVSKMTLQIQQDTKLRENANQNDNSLQQTAASVTSKKDEEIAELRRWCDFYQKNSERLSKEHSLSNKATSPPRRQFNMITEAQAGSLSGSRMVMPGAF